MTNRDVLIWLKSWDSYIFRKSDQTYVICCVAILCSLFLLSFVTVSEPRPATEVHLSSIPVPKQKVTYTESAVLCVLMSYRTGENGEE